MAFVKQKIAVVPELLGSTDPARRDRVIGAIITMKKLDIDTLKRAYAGAQDCRSSL